MTQLCFMFIYIILQHTCSSAQTISYTVIYGSNITLEKPKNNLQVYTWFYRNTNKGECPSDPETDISTYEDIKLCENASNKLHRYNRKKQCMPEQYNCTSAGLHLYNVHNQGTSTYLLIQQDSEKSPHATANTTYIVNIVSSTTPTLSPNPTTMHIVTLAGSFAQVSSKNNHISTVVVSIILTLMLITGLSCFCYRRQLYRYLR
ncbi:truncated Cy08 [Cynomolgus cytomegalovirus]|uniref:Uncharacterized protein n=1 Tax=Cynomolgus macaque cytomegalovirus strain Mauritius TaxID=1690255 RepID=A0A0K1H033_9BETA|nr:truncated Cy08 [Cynomolgus cytomegalovirus]AKT72765.1 hypothetical protein [Cynomolgus macaque cytomegalovirus strain Mauritius]AXG21709.1 hypothetical protein [synthetic construct]APT39230.1 truncated Cy08 [Cynomolgus cytomegalovirus]APT39403.1 truncated Cy08 [Cynomolgus cytomegalovirus]APT39576.1 truncated Cy08 [Cynomolgus cytomegalovirus]